MESRLTDAIECRGPLTSQCASSCAIGGDTRESRAFELTSRAIESAPMRAEHFAQMNSSDHNVTATADGVYDSRACHDAITAKRGKSAERSVALRQSPEPINLETLERIPPPQPS